MAGLMSGIACGNSLPPCPEYLASVTITLSEA